MKYYVIPRGIHRGVYSSWSTINEHIKVSPDEIIQEDDYIKAHSYVLPDYNELGYYRKTAYISIYYGVYYSIIIVDGSTLVYYTGSIIPSISNEAACILVVMECISLTEGDIIINVPYHICSRLFNSELHLYRNIIQYTRIIETFIWISKHRNINVISTHDSYLTILAYIIAECHAKKDNSLIKYKNKLLNNICK